MISTPTVLELGEHERDLFPTSPPTPGDLRLAEHLGAGGGGPRLDIRWLLDGRVEITTTSWVGTVRFSDFEIRITPKLAGGELGVLRMLAHTTRSDLLRSLPDQDLPERGPNLFDLLCQLLAQEAETVLRRGLLRDYRSVDDSIEVLRGRLRHRDQILRRFGRLEQLECTFDEHDADIPENRFIAAALHMARRRVSDPDIRRRINRLHHAFEGACSAPTFDPDWYRDRITPNRRNDHYRTAHHLADLVLRHLAFDDLHTPSTELNAFLLDMNRLFEAFISQVLADATPGTHLHIGTQDSFRSVIRNDLTGHTYTTIRPDLVVTNRYTGRHAPIDIKYKRYDEQRISTADLYQTFVYAYALHSPDETARAALLYPVEPTCSDNLVAAVRERISIRDGAGRTGANLLGIGLDVVGLLDVLSGTTNERDDGLEEIRQLIRQVLAAPGPGA